MTNKIELHIHDRAAFAGGHAFGDTGPYERLHGRAQYAVDPKAAAQAGIVDLDKAPVNDRGLVEFAADVFILRPADLSKGNRRLFYDFGNRGNMRALQFFNDAAYTNDPKTLAHAGNGFLFRRGYTFVWSAWQGDLFPGNGRVTLDVPVATDRGKPITGFVRVEFRPARAGIVSYPLSGWPATKSYPAVSLDTSQATLTKRRYAEDERIPIPAEAWQFARIEGGAGLDNQETEIAVVPSDRHIYMPGGFETGWLYELVYTAKDPLVLGLGFAAVRDLVSFLKYEDTDAAGAKNPVRDGAGVDYAYAWGRSQTGRVIRNYLHLGFNCDSQGRKVFDGMMPHVSGAGMMWMNHRFANLNGTAGQQYEDHFNIADRFPFSYAETTDHITGKTDAILKRPDTDPLLIHTQTGTEYWQRHGSLVHTDTKGNDLAQPDSVRIFVWSSTQHFANPAASAPTRGISQNLNNVVNTSMFFRALLDALDRWVTDGIAPPASRVPTRKDGTLVAYDEWRKQFPAIPGHMIPWDVNQLSVYDFGPRQEAGIFDKQPPDVVGHNGYTILVPAVDADGNDIAGARAPMVAAPLATYAGWNLRGRGHGYGAMHEFTGSTIPFPDTPEERKATNDPRRSVQERYKDAQGYVAAIVKAAKQLVADGLILEEDLERIERDAQNFASPRHDVKL
ncbi:MAG: alpha/beta hydrolase domain-containing protein [Rhodospirillales bacterium]